MVISLPSVYLRTKHSHIFMEHKKDTANLEMTTKQDAKTLKYNRDRCTSAKERLHTILSSMLKIVATTSYQDSCFLHAKPTDCQSSFMSSSKNLSRSLSHPSMISPPRMFISSSETKSSATCSLSSFSRTKLNGFKSHILSISAAIVLSLSLNRPTATS